MTGSGTSAPSSTNSGGTNGAYSGEVEFDSTTLSQHGNAANPDNETPNTHTPGTVTYTLTVTPVLHWRNQNNSGPGYSTPPKNVAYRLYAHAYSGTQTPAATQGTSDADDGLGDPNVGNSSAPGPGDSDSSGYHVRYYNNAGHNPDIYLPSFTMTASATGGYDVNGNGFFVYARTDAKISMTDVGFSHPRGDGATHRPTGGGHQTSSPDPSFTRWLPLSFSPVINSQPFRYETSGALPAPWGNLSCAYSINIRAVPPNPEAVPHDAAGHPLPGPDPNYDLSGVTLLYYYSGFSNGIYLYKPLAPPQFIPCWVITDANGERLLFNQGLEVYPDMHCRLQQNANGTFKLINAGPPGAMKARGFYTYNFDTNRRLVSITDNRGNQQTLSYSSGGPVYADGSVFLTVTDSSSGRALQFFKGGGYITAVHTSGTPATRTTTEFDASGHLQHIKVYQDGDATLLHQDDFTYSNDSVAAEAQGVSQLAYTWAGDPYLSDPYQMPIPRLRSMTAGTSGDTASSDDGGSVQGTITYGYGVTDAGGLGVYTPQTLTNSVTDPRGNLFQTEYTLNGLHSALTGTTSGAGIMGSILTSFMRNEEIQGPINATRTTGPDFQGAPLGSNVSSVGYYPDMINPFTINATDQLGHNWQAYLNGLGQLCKTVDPLNHVWQWTYDNPTGVLLTTAKDPTNLIWTYQYAEGGAASDELTSILDPGNATRLSLTYNTFGQVLTETIPAAASATGANETTTYAYDATTGDLRNILNALGEQMSIGNYDPLGDARLVAVFPDTGDPTTTNQTLTTTVDYDAAQMPKVITDPSGTKQVTTFANGIPTQFSITDSANSLLSQMTLSYDTRGRVYAATDAVGTLAQYRYDKSSNRTKVVDGNGNTTRFTYGSNDEPLSVIWPDNRSAGYLYDAAGRLAQSTDERGVLASYSYDDANRPTDIQFPSTSSQNVHTTYDDADRLLSVTDSTGGRTYSYDSVRKRLSSVTVSLGGRTYVISYTYYPDGSVHTMSSPAGTTTYTYDALGRLKQLSNPEGRQTTWTYDHAGRVTSEETNTLGAEQTIPLNGAETNSVVDEDGVRPPTRIGAVLKSVYTWGVSGLTSDPSTAPAYLRTITETVNNAPRYAYTLTHSYLGQVQEQSGTTLSSGAASRYDVQDYGYDGRGRLNGEGYTLQYPGNQPILSSANYTFDLAGNLLAGSGGWSYNSSNQVTSAPPTSGLNGSPYLAYDYSGNVTRLDTAAENVTLSYDVWGRMASRVGTASGTTIYTYDAAGRRVSKTLNGTTTYYLYDGGMLLCEMDSLGNITHAYTWGALGLISDIVNGTTARFVFSDGTGSVRALLDSNGNTLGTAVYTAWGSTFDSSLPANLPFTWCGRAGAYNDGQSGLYLMGARYYSAALGRFLSRDPSGFGSGPNLYAYCAGDPINAFDANGMESEYWLTTFVNRIRPYVNAGNNFSASPLGQLLSSSPIGSTFQGALSVPNSIIGLHDSWDNWGTTAGRYEVGKASGWDLFKAGGIACAETAAAAGSIYGAGKMANGLLREVPPPGSIGCFVAGTLVTDASGQSKPIEQYAKGEMLATRCENADGKHSSLLSAQSFTEGKQIENTSVRTVDTVLTVSLADAQTGKIVDSITATRNHPFYVDGKGWTPAGGLAIGNAIVTRAGPPLVVAKVEWKLKKAGEPGFAVYNFVVEADHTYFVGKANGGVWVHNGPLDCPEYLQGKTFPNSIEEMDSMVAPKGIRTKDGMKWNLNEHELKAEAHGPIYNPETGEIDRFLPGHSDLHFHIKGPNGRIGAGTYLPGEPIPPF